jgi:hypothetical protein
VHIPDYVDKITIVASDEDTGDDCFEMYTEERFLDDDQPDVRMVDHPRIAFDAGVEYWATPHIRNGRKYMHIEYDE